MERRRVAVQAVRDSRWQDNRAAGRSVQRFEFGLFRSAEHSRRHGGRRPSDEHVEPGATDPAWGEIHLLRELFRESAAGPVNFAEHRQRKVGHTEAGTRAMASWSARSRALPALLALVIVCAAGARYTNARAFQTATPVTSSATSSSVPTDVDHTREVLN